MRAYEHRLRAAPRVKLRLGAGTALLEVLRAQEIWLKRLEDRYGPRLELVADKKLEERDYDLSE